MVVRDRVRSPRPHREPLRPRAHAGRLERGRGGALIAAEASPLGLGTDGGGSIRVPSHYCGIVGIRPSARLVPETGCWPSTRDTGMLDMSTIGPTARSVDDVALALRLVAGEDGVWPPTAATAGAVRRAAAVLAEAGARVDEAVPPPLGEATEIFFGMMAADGGARARADLAPAGGRHVAQMTRLLETLRDSALPAAGFFELVVRWSGFRARLRAFVAGFDVVLSAVTPAPLHGCRPGDDLPVDSYLPWANVQAYSIAGLPVAVVPVASERGLPIGVQVAASAFRDEVALAAAAALEEALGGFAAVSRPLLTA